MANIIIIYSTTDGHTREICAHLMQTVEGYGNLVTLVSIDNYKKNDLKKFDKIVIGASIRYGKHHEKVYELIETNAQILENTPSAFFSVNVVARKPEKNKPETNPYLQKFLRQIPWEPKLLAVFAGKIEYQKYKFWDRHMIRLIMWMTKGPTDPKANIDFTDWKKVTEFGQTISKM